MIKFDRIEPVELADERLHICKESIGKPLNFRADGKYLFCNYCDRLIGVNE